MYASVLNRMPGNVASAAGPRGSQTSYCVGLVSKLASRNQPALAAMAGVLGSEGNTVWWSAVDMGSERAGAI